MRIKLLQMKKNLLLSVLTIVLFASGYAQNPLWKKTSAEKVGSLPVVERASTPMKAELFELNLEAMKTSLQQAPHRDEQGSSNVIVAFPLSDGTLANFRMFEAPVMDAELAARYPDSKSYVGQGVEDKSTSVRISTTIFGLHAMIYSDKGTTVVDPYTTNLSNYIVYAKNQLVSTRSFECLVEDDEELAEGLRGVEVSQLISDGKFRTYRLAMACTIEYAAFHVNAAGLNSGTLAQKKAAVLAAMNVTMTRVNGLYERDMSLTMVLVANNDAVIFIDADNFDNANAGTLINQSQTVIDGAIGSANYDIGHTVSTGGGGLASLNSPCTGGKARGITGSPAPVGDPFDIDYVAHEMGHQFGATHTFNNSCGGNRSSATAVEPGSGSTIMAYAGICAPDVQNNSDDHFHAVSIAQMTAFVLGNGNCAANINNNNIAPVVSAGPDFTIPTSTAFILKGTATDANGDALSYNWEQVDNQINGGIGNFVVANPPLPTNNAGPAFRSISSLTSPNRYMPNFTSVLAGNLAPTWEVVPSVARVMNFALTVRDNRSPNGGQTTRDDMKVTTVATGPFRVTSPAVENQYWAAGSTQTVTWDVAGTTGNGINTAAVNILLSTDAGATFSTVLATAIPNTGTASITLPAGVVAAYSRIMIEPVGNIYYAVSKSIAIGYTVETVNTCNTYPGVIANPNIVGLAAPQFSALGTATVPVADNVVITDLNFSVNITHANINDLYIGLVKPGSTSVDRIVYQQTCTTANGGQNIIVKYDDQAANLSCAGIGGNNSYKPLNTLDIFNGQNSQGGWRIAVADVTVPNSGTLNSFSVEICSTTTTVTLATESFGFADFAVYPNPNNGNFNVRFDNASANGVKILVHDLGGRKIFENAYPGVATFNENIQLNNVQAGVYLMSVTDGDKKEVKRIVIE